MHTKATLRRTLVLLGGALLGATVGCGGGGDGGIGPERIDKQSAYSFEETLTRLTAGIRDVNLVLVKEVDYQTMLRMVNMETEGLRSLEVFHPRYGARLFGADRSAGLEVPMRLFVRQDGDRAVVSYYRPSSVLRRYSGMGDLGRELDEVFDRMTDAATR